MYYGRSPDLCARARFRRCFRKRGGTKREHPPETCHPLPLMRMDLSDLAGKLILEARPARDEIRARARGSRGSEAESGLSTARARALDATRCVA